MPINKKKTNHANDLEARVAELEKRVAELEAVQPVTQDEFDAFKSGLHDAGIRVLDKGQ